MPREVSCSGSEFLSRLQASNRIYVPGFWSGKAIWARALQRVLIGDSFMKHKILAMMLAVTVMSWAQTATQTSPATPQQSTTPAEKPKCACCDKMAGTNADHAACMRHGHGDTKEMASCCSGKEGMPCCGGKDAKSCMKGDKTGESCCKEGCGKEMKVSCCNHKAGKQCGKGCCASNKSEKPA